MPEYAADLLEYAERVGDDRPYKALEEPDFRARTLSKEAPMALVRHVAAAVESIDDDPVIESLSEYERARVFLALERNDEASELYSSAYESSDDPEIRAMCLCGMSNCLADFDEKKALIVRAIDEEGYVDGYMFLGGLYFNDGKVVEAVKTLKEGILKGSSLCIGTLLHVYICTHDDVNSPDFQRLMLEIPTLAEAGGIADWWDEPFRRFNQMFMAKDTDGHFINWIAVMEPARKIIDMLFRQQEEALDDSGKEGSEAEETSKEGDELIAKEVKPVGSEIATALRSKLETDGHGDGKKARMWLEAFYVQATKEYYLLPEARKALAEVYEENGWNHHAKILKG